ncbi:MAG: MotA/TolQ/ExbB proton channel family protein [Bacteroidales bacterium]|nr:MotA/TolQ/ExbB proton channel family protein [Bacteroidales bacterium]
MLEDNDTKTADKGNDDNKNAKLSNIITEKLHYDEKIEFTRNKILRRVNKKLILTMFVIPVLAFSLAILTFYIVDNAFSKGDFIKRMLFPKEGWHQSVLPFVIILMFFWSLIDILIKGILIIHKHKDLKNETILNSHNIMANNGIEFTMDQLWNLNEKIKNRFVFKRVFSMINHLNSDENPVRCHEYIRHQLEIDFDTAASGYTTARIFIWAMPILGFIGTVMGIGLAVGGFSNFLSGDVASIHLVQEQLGSVAGGLSFAFDTTLLGLATSLIAMFYATFIQNQDQKLITNLDELCLKIIAAFKPKSTSSSGIQSSDNFAANESIESLKDVLELSITNLNEFNQKFSDILKINNDKWGNLLNTFASNMEPFQAALKNNTRTLETLNSLNNVLGNVQKTLERLNTPVESEDIRSQNHGQEKV